MGVTAQELISPRVHGLKSSWNTDKIFASTCHEESMYVHEESMYVHWINRTLQVGINEKLTEAKSTNL